MNIPPPNNQSYSPTEVSLPRFISLWLCTNLDNDTFAISNTQSINVHGDQWLVKDCKLSSQFVFCRLCQSWNVMFPPAAVQADDTKATKVPSQHLRLLHDLCSFSTFHVRPRENYWSLRCFNTLCNKYLHVITSSFHFKCAVQTKFF